MRTVPFWTFKQLTLAAMQKLSLQFDNLELCFFFILNLSTLRFALPIKSPQYLHNSFLIFTKLRKQLNIPPPPNHQF